MKRFRFQQESLLRLRRQLRRQAEIRLWRARHLVNQSESNLANLMTELGRLSTVPTGGRDGLAVWSWRMGTSALQSEISRTQQTLAERKQAHEKIHREFQRCDAEFEALNLLRTNQWDEHRKNAAGEQQLNLDESAMRRWLTQPADQLEIEVDD